MSAVFDVVGGIIEAIIAILEAIASAIAAIFEAIPAVLGALSEVAGIVVQIFEDLVGVLAAVPKVLDGIVQAMPGQIALYASWTGVQLVLLAYLPTFALIINGLFFIYTIYGLVQGAQEVFGAPTLVAAGIAGGILALNVYLAFA